MDTQSGGDDWSGGQGIGGQSTFMAATNSILDMDDETRAEFYEVRLRVSTGFATRVLKRNVACPAGPLFLERLSTSVYFFADLLHDSQDVCAPLPPTFPYLQQCSFRLRIKLLRTWSPLSAATECRPQLSTCARSTAAAQSHGTRQAAPAARSQLKL